MGSAQGLFGRSSYYRASDFEPIRRVGSGRRKGRCVEPTAGAYSAGPARIGGPISSEAQVQPDNPAGEVAEIADAIVSDKELPADRDNVQADELLLAATSMGGARPKAVVEDTDGLWVAKSNRPDDKWNVARIEHAMLVLAPRADLPRLRASLSSL